MLVAHFVPFKVTTLGGQVLDTFQVYLHVNCRFGMLYTVNHYMSICFELSHCFLTIISHARVDFYNFCIFVIFLFFLCLCACNSNFYCCQWVIIYMYISIIKFQLPNVLPSQSQHEWTSVIF